MQGGGYEGKHSGGGSKFGGGSRVFLSDFVTEENQKRCLKLRGLPFSADVNQIREFFKDFEVQDENIIIDCADGRPTGYAMVILKSDDDAAQAKKDLNKKCIGNRYVDLNMPELKRWEVPVQSDKLNKQNEFILNTP